MPLIRSISGLRGTIGDTLTPEVVVRYIDAFARFVGQGEVVLGRDGRPSGVWIERLAEGALRAAGRSVRMIGMAPTPTVQLATERSSAVGGISITASHNPSQWNGLKFLGADGVFLGPDDCLRLFSIVDAGGFEGGSLVGDARDDANAIGDHVELVLSLPFINIEGLRGRRFTVVVDAVNASGSMIVPLLLECCGCRVIPLHCDGSGLFPHAPEPLPENLGDLASAVIEHRADLGIAVDPDADRLVVIDERGNPIGEEYTVTQAIDFILRGERRRDPLKSLTAVVNLSTTRAVDDVAVRHGARVERTPVGEINVARRMLEIGAPIGGEGSGGVIFPELHAGRDSLVGIAILLSDLLESGLQMSALRAALPPYDIVKRKQDLAPGTSVDALFDTIARSVASDAIVRRDDGLRIDLKEGWVHMRVSNTEPVVRVIAEARGRAEAERLAKAYTAMIAAT